jgi:predicted methyltransferase
MLCDNAAGLRRARTILLLGAALAAGYVLEEAVRTLSALDRIEHDRDTWQRPEAVLEPLHVHSGSVVVDLGAGAGYFTLKLAPLAGPAGAVVAVDLRRESLAFLWIRSRLERLWNVRVVVGTADDPRVPGGLAVDSVLIANTFHELEHPQVLLKRIRASMRPTSRLVVVDRRPRADATRAAATHGVEPGVARRIIEDTGFKLVQQEVSFIDRAGDDEIWWLQVFEPTGLPSNRS